MQQTIVLPSSGKTAPAVRPVVNRYADYRACKKPRFIEELTAVEIPMKHDPSTKAQWYYDMTGTVYICYRTAGREKWMVDAGTMK